MSFKNKNKEKKTFEEKELEILRAAVDDIEKTSKIQVAQSPDVAKLIEILENFLRKKQLICYGGTALNNILPKQDQFYDKSIEIPDYDFYSSNALEDAKELAKLYASLGYDDVEAKAGMHVGTFKVQVHFIPLADITQMEKTLFLAIKKEAIKIDGILYAPSNLLRLNVYKELSRPNGQVDRWEKIYKRLLLLNKHYPIKKQKCNSVQFMRDFEGNKELGETVYMIVKNSIIKQGLVFFGGYACSLFQRYLPLNNNENGTRKNKKQMKQAPDFDALAEKPEEASLKIKQELESKGIKNVKVYKKPGAGEIIAPHYEVAVGKDSVCFIYEALGCHSYNTIHVKNNTVKNNTVKNNTVKNNTVKNNAVKIATIDTMLNLFLAFLYANRPYYDSERILCMAQYLFNIQQKNRLNQQGLLKRFTKECYGTETTIQTIRETRSKKFKELKPYRNKPNTKNGKEYDQYFLRYAPGEKKTVFRKKHAKPVLTKKVDKKNKTKNTKINNTKINNTKINNTKINNNTKTKKNKWFLF